MDEKEIARRFLTDAFAGGRKELLDELLGEAYVDHDMPEENPMGNGPAGVRFMIDAFRSGFPDIRCDIEDQLTEEDRVATRCRMVGTNTGPFFGAPPTGGRMDLPAITIYRIQEGKIAEAWVTYDNALLQKQLARGSAPGRSL
jgi:steroid delta-isomerase-like uncharacterized protein